MLVLVWKGELHHAGFLDGKSANQESFSSYVLFSISNVTPLFKASYKECWSTGKVCNPNWIAAVNYFEVVGILIGQIIVGLLGDW